MISLECQIYQNQPNNVRWCWKHFIYLTGIKTNFFTYVHRRTKTNGIKTTVWNENEKTKKIVILRIFNLFDIQILDRLWTKFFKNSLRDNTSDRSAKLECGRWNCFVQLESPIQAFLQFIFGPITRRQYQQSIVWC